VTDFSIPDAVTDLPEEWQHTCKDGDGECGACAVRDCPHKEPLHYHHDGCPACWAHDPW
jgi:hypothetical protein